MPDSIIDQVNQIGKQEHDIKGLVFRNRHKDLLDNCHTDPAFNLDNTTNVAAYPVTSAELPGVDLEHHNPTLPSAEQPYEQTDTDYDDPNDLAEASAQNADKYAVYGNWVAPDTSLETDHLQQFAETAEDMVDNQVSNSEIEYQYQNQPNTTQLPGDNQINAHDD